MEIEIEKYVNGKKVKVPLSEANKPKPKNDKERLEQYKGERSEIDKEKKAWY